MNYNDEWNISKKALQGTPGIWYHVNFHKQKSDLHPQPEIIEMLKGLSK